MLSFASLVWFGTVIFVNCIIILHLVNVFSSFCIRVNFLLASFYFCCSLPFPFIHFVFSCTSSSFPSPSTSVPVPVSLLSFSSFYYSFHFPFIHFGFSCTIFLLFLLSNSFYVPVPILLLSFSSFHYSLHIPFIHFPFSCISFSFPSPIILSNDSQYTPRSSC